MTHNPDEYRPQSKEEEIVRRAFIVTLVAWRGPDKPKWKDFWAAYNAQKQVDERQSGDIWRGRKLVEGYREIMKDTLRKKGIEVD